MRSNAAAVIAVISLAPTAHAQNMTTAGPMTPSAPSLQTGAGVAVALGDPVNRGGGVTPPPAGSPLNPANKLADVSNRPAAAANLNLGGLARRIDPTAPAYGAKCDGATDDAAALQAAINALSHNATFYVPGVCVFKTPLVFPAYSYGLSIIGNGLNSQLVYKGSATTGNLITIGSYNYKAGGYCSAVRLTIRDVNFASGTAMTAGDGVRINDACDFDIANVSVGGDFGQKGDLTGNQNFYNGIHFNGGNSAHVRGLFASAGQGGAAELVNGDTAQQFTDLYQTQSKINHSTIGVEIAGYVGGFTLDQTDILTNGTNVQIDQSQVAKPSGALFFGPGVAIDGTSGGAGIGVNITDPGLPNSGGNSWLTFTGTWLASSANQCMEVGSGTYWNITYAGGNIINCGAGGVRNDSANATINIAGTRFWNNSRSDIINNVPSNPRITAQAVYSDLGAFASGAGAVVGFRTNAFGDVAFNTIGNLFLQASIGGKIALFGVSGSSTCDFTSSGSGIFAPTLGDGSGTACPAQLGASGAPFLAYASATVAAGAAPANSGSCAIANQVGGNTAGSFKFKGACSRGTVVLNFATRAPNGWSCAASNMGSSTAIPENGYSQTTAQLYVSSASSGQQASFTCTAF